MNPRILLLGGLPEAYADALRRALPPDGAWCVRAAADPDAVLAALADGPPPAFVLLDASALGPASLLALCRAARRAAAAPAAVRIEALLPALSPDALRAAYAAGSDECRAAPLSAEALAAIVAAKAPPAVADAVLLDPATGAARLDGRPLDLSCTEIRLLRELLSRPGVARTRGELLRASLGGDAASVQLRAVDSAIFGLRRKLGPAGWRLETAWGRGYRWNAAPRPPLGARLVRRRARVLGPDARALLAAFATDAPPAVDIARPKPAEESADFTV